MARLELAKRLYKGLMLPITSHLHGMGMVGLEPTADRLKAGCSNH